MTDQTETYLRDMLRRRAEDVDEDAVTGESVRAYAGRPDRRGGTGRVPVAAAAAIVALVAGVLLAVGHGGTDPRPRPGSPAVSVRHSPSSTAVPTHALGSVPRCPSTTHAPGSSNTVCMIGHGPRPRPGQVIISSEHP